jgi:hypothetical protein
VIGQAFLLLDRGAPRQGLQTELPIRATKRCGTSPNGPIEQSLALPSWNGRRLLS